MAQRNHFRLNKETGQLTGIIDASKLLTLLERENLKEEEVLNGIAYYPEHQTFLITGKGWPKLFEVRFIPVGKLP